MRRREFITLVGGAAVWPLSARAQQHGMPVIGLPSSESPEVFASRLRAFHQGLGEAGFVEGRNVAVEYRWANARYEQLPGLLTDLVSRQVNVIALGGLPATRAAKAATTTIPIIFQMGVDPVKAGLVASLNLPGGNLTGITSLNVEVGPKRLELLHELIPSATVMALLVNPTNPNAEDIAGDMQTAARTRGLKLHVVHASSEKELRTLFATFGRTGASGLVVGNDGFSIGRNEQIAALGVRYSVPTIFQFREFASAGGLVSYGGSIAEAFRSGRRLYWTSSQGREARRTSSPTVNQG